MCIKLKENVSKFLYWLVKRTEGQVEPYLARYYSANNEIPSGNE